MFLTNDVLVDQIDAILYSYLAEMNEFLHDEILT